MKCRDLYFVLIVAFLMTGFKSGAEARTTYIESSSLEKLSSLQKSPTGWFKTEIPKTKEHIEFIWDEDTSYKDEMSISIKISEEHPEETVIAYNWYTIVHNWEEEHSYEFSCWVKGQGLNKPIWVCVQCWDEDMTKMLKFATTQIDYPLTGTFEWQKIGAVFTIPTDTHKVVLRAGIAAPGNNGGQAWFDEVHIREVSEKDE